MRKIIKVKFIGEMRELSDELVPINAGDLRDLISGVKVLFPASAKYFLPHRQMCIDDVNHVKQNKSCCPVSGRE